MPHWGGTLSLGFHLKTLYLLLVPVAPMARDPIQMAPLGHGLQVVTGTVPLYHLAIHLLFHLSPTQTGGGPGLQAKFDKIDRDLKLHTANQFPPSRDEVELSNFKPDVRAEHAQGSGSGLYLWMPWPDALAGWVHQSPRLPCPGCLFPEKPTAQSPFQLSQLSHVLSTVTEGPKTHPQDNSEVIHAPQPLH